MVKHQWLVISIVLSVLSVPAYADRGSDPYKHGDHDEHQGNLDSAYTYYKQAHDLVPDNAKYLAAYTRLRFSAAQQHVHTGQLLRDTGALAEALTHFQRAVEIDNTSFIAQQELRLTTEMIRRKEQQKSAPKLDSPLAKGTADLADALELQPLSNAPITLHLTANADTAYRTIAKLAGLNVLIDPDYRPQKITIDLTDVTLRGALDMVRLQSKTIWHPVLANTIFVTTDSAAKRKELEPNVMKTFYLRNLATQAELQEAATTIRQMLDVTRVQLLQGQDALVVRATPDQMILIDKLLSDIDKPKSEVVIDLAVMEVSRDKVRTLGSTVPTSVSVGVLPSINANTGAGGFSLGNFAFSVSGGSFTALATDSNTKLLQNPSIRVLNDGKATLRIGDRVPIATGSFAGAVGGTGVSPLVSTQFQYLDVGVNIDITPHIHSDQEVTLKMSLEISSVTGQQTIGGITQPVIGQRRIDHETRLSDGEVNLVGGILQDSETQSMSGYPWLSKLPILRYFFSQDNRERTNQEIVFAITPHIVRGKEVTDENLRMIAIGTGSQIELRHKPPATAPEHAADAAKPQPPAPRAPAAAIKPQPPAPEHTAAAIKPEPPVPGAPAPVGQ